MPSCSRTTNSASRVLQLSAARQCRAALFVVPRMRAALARRSRCMARVARRRRRQLPSAAGIAGVRGERRRATNSTRPSPRFTRRCVRAIRIRSTTRIGSTSTCSARRWRFIAACESGSRCRYGALIALPEGGAGCCRARRSCSSRHERRRAARAADERHGPAFARSDADRERAFLAHDPKNRAENVMIVDLLRNDLSRVARDGLRAGAGAFFGRAVCVRLADDVDGRGARCAPGTSFADCCARCFPCGSITGAPKHQARCS